MTRYEQGFMNKCAEYGVDPSAVVEFAMRKMAQSALPNIGTGGGFKLGDLTVGGGTVKGGGGAGIGAVSPSGGVGAFLSSNAIGNSILGAGAGALTGLAMEHFSGGDRKEYLKRMLRMALLGAAVGGVGTMITSAPNYLSKIRNSIAKGVRP